jgi:hypothetical protein
MLLHLTVKIFVSYAVHQESVITNSKYIVFSRGGGTLARAAQL